MLDSETKHRIDTARDILVGKVPDPKSQVEQITIALIYKFMDDMDIEAEELGGVRSFFVGEYEKFSWAKLLSPALGGSEMLGLYIEAIEKMTRNEGIPQLFRDIFKNAYLPYRDPETLRLFLKTINEFNYEHSEKLGDAFEYLLSVLGSQGDAGQFRTPRHIIDFMVKVVDPRKEDSILDPACGTAGFLISAYKHVMANNAKDGKPGGALTTDQRKKLAENIRGYDISPDMVRLSLVNLYLHGFSTPNIYEYDTLTSEDRWNEYADVILANPPFMSPKGGIRPHKRFSVQSNRSEVLFVDYMAEHLTPNGRAAIIVPEGIIFQSAGAYKQLRKYMIENNLLWAVVSLPAGVFNPYSGVKTSILFLDKVLARKTDKILFVKIEKDGYDLGAQRRGLCNEMGDKPELCPTHSDLPDALNTMRNWHKTVLEDKSDSFSPIIENDLTVPISKLGEVGDFNLSADRYREVIRVGKQTYKMVELGDMCEIISGQSPEGKYYNKEGKGMPFYQGKTEFTDKYIEEPTIWTTSVTKVAEKDDILMSVRAPVGPVNIATKKLCIGRGLAAIRPDTSKILLEYAFIILKQMQDEIKGNSGSTFASINRRDIAKIQIPLPSLEIQNKIVTEITSHQRIIDGARQIVENWEPNLELELSESLQDGLDKWDTVKLGDICNFEYGKSLRADNRIDGQYPVYGSNGIVGYHNEFLVEAPFLVIGRKGSAGEVHYSNKNGFPIDTTFYIKLENEDKVTLMFLFLKLKYLNLQSVNTQAGVPGLNRNDAYKINIQIPPLEIQHNIVSRIEHERLIVEGNRELIQLYEEKIKKVIERVWEE